LTENAYYNEGVIHKITLNKKKEEVR